MRANKEYTYIISGVLTASPYGILMGYAAFYTLAQVSVCGMAYAADNNSEESAVDLSIFQQKSDAEARLWCNDSFDGNVTYEEFAPAITKYGKCENYLSVPSIYISKHMWNAAPSPEACNDLCVTTTGCKQFMYKNEKVATDVDFDRQNFPYCLLTDKESCAFTAQATDPPDYEYTFYDTAYKVGTQANSEYKLFLVQLI